MAREVSERLKNVRMSGRRTHAEMEDLRIAQVTGETKQIKANRAGKIADEHFKKDYADYRINDHDADSYHVAMEARLFNTQTGAKISRSKVQIFDPVTFRQLVANNGFHGHTTFILHDPTVASSNEGKYVAGVDQKTGEVKTTGAGESEQTSTPMGGQGDPNAGNVPTNDPNEGVNSASADGGNDNPDDPNAVDVDGLNEFGAKALYFDLTGKSADGRWSLERLKEEIKELQGNVE